MVGSTAPAWAQSVGGGGDPGVQQARVSPFFLAILSAGTVVLVLWIIRRIVRPSKLLLSDSPGRPNRLHPLVALAALLVALVSLSSLSGWAGMTAQRPYGLGAMLLSHLALSAGAVVLARQTFRHGAVRGMGLSLRHGVWDALRGTVAYLAVLPVCIALISLMRLLLPAEAIKIHPLLELIGSLATFWQVVLFVATAVTTPILEEILFRGLVQSSLRQATGRPWLAVGITSAIFAFMHGQPQDWLALAVLAGVMGYNYERTGRLIAPIVTHALFNAVFLAETLYQVG